MINLIGYELRQFIFSQSFQRLTFFTNNSEQSLAIFYPVFPLIVFLYVVLPKFLINNRYHLLICRDLLSLFKAIRWKQMVLMILIFFDLEKIRFFLNFLSFDFHFFLSFWNLVSSMRGPIYFFALNFNPFVGLRLQLMFYNLYRMPFLLLINFLLFLCCPSKYSCLKQVSLFSKWDTSEHRITMQNFNIIADNFNSFIILCFRTLIIIFSLVNLWLFRSLFLPLILTHLLIL